MKWFLISILLIQMLFFSDVVCSDKFVEADLLIREVFSIRARNVNNHCSIRFIINEPDSAHPLYRYVHQQYYYLNYLLYNVSSYDIKQLKAYCSDKHRLDSIFYHYLNTSPSFKEAYLSSCSRYYSAKGVTIQGIPIKSGRDTIFVSDLLTIAVRFFYPDRIENDSIKGRICVGINGLKDYTQRNYPAEAFVFSAIFNQIVNNDQFGVYQKYKNTMHLLSSLRLSNDQEKTLERARGALWMELYQFEPLKQALF
ncbi:MAG: hypothetical protein Kow00108_05060 [Calditrichia bacterium]